MSLIKYPETDYNSFVDEAEADTYFEGRLHANVWDTTQKEAALLTAYRSLEGLNITIDPTDSAQLDLIERAQLEQALFEAARDVDAPAFSSMNLGGLLAVKMPSSQIPQPRYSPRAMALLKAFMTTSVIERTR